MCPLSDAPCGNAGRTMLPVHLGWFRLEKPSEGCVSQPGTLPAKDVAEDKQV